MKRFRFGWGASGASVLTLLLFSGQPACADFDALGNTKTKAGNTTPTTVGDDWLQTFEAHGQAQTMFDTITVALGSGFTFASPGLENFGKDASPSWHVTSFSANSITATGNAANWALWNFAFNGAAPPSQSHVMLDLTAYLNGVVVEHAMLDFHHSSEGNWTWQIVPVPESTTLFAGAGAVGMLLFGVGIRSKRTKVVRIGK
jgi:hypothetical protein